jgi:hypothetical protein
MAEFLAYWWPVLLLALGLWIVSRPKVWYWAIGLPWRLFWRALTRR